MPFIFHELLHVLLSLLIAFAIWKLFHLRSKIKYLGFLIIASFLGGFLVDADHLFDYVLAFGLRFRLDYFLKGYQFLKSDKIYLPLHSWELVIILLTIALLLNFINLMNFMNLKNLMNFKNFITLQTLIFAFSLSLFFHLVVDMKVDYVSLRGYSLIYRTTHAFDLKYFVTEEHYRRHVKLKNDIKL